MQIVRGKIIAPCSSHVNPACLASNLPSFSPMSRAQTHRVLYLPNTFLGRRPMNTTMAAPHNCNSHSNRRVNGARIGWLGGWEWSCVGGLGEVDWTGLGSIPVGRWCSLAGTAELTAHPPEPADSTARLAFKPRYRPRMQIPNTMRCFQLAGLLIGWLAACCDHARTLPPTRPAALPPHLPPSSPHPNRRYWS